MTDKIKIKLVKSSIGTTKKVREVLRGLGLRKIRQIVERKDNPQTRGMIEKVSHLVEIVEEENENDG